MQGHIFLGLVNLSLHREASGRKRHKNHATVRFGLIFQGLVHLISPSLRWELVALHMNVSPAHITTSQLSQ